MGDNKEWGGEGMRTGASRRCGWDRKEKNWWHVETGQGVQEILAFFIT
jgi:hypothetical protein